MLNFYPLWKYVMLLLVLFISFLYALPNLYGEDPALQIIATRRSAVVSESILTKIQAILKEQHILSKSFSLKNGVVLICFSDQNKQLYARQALTKALGENYTIVLNLVSTAPHWLAKIGAEPIKLGLDLRGGLHFLVEVNTDITFDKLQEEMINTIRGDFREKNIAYVRIDKVKHYGNEIYFHDTHARDKAISCLKIRYKDLVISSYRDNILRLRLTDNHLNQVRKYTLQKIITVLRNRINQLGVSEALVQHQGSYRIVLELPGVQDAAWVKEILGASITLKFLLVNNLVNQLDIVNGHVPDDSEVKMTRDGQPIVLYKKLILTGDHIIDSSFGIDEYNRPQVNIFLDENGGTIMSNVTKNNIGKLMATLLVEYKDIGKKDINGRALLEKQEEVINIATIQSRLGNSFRISGIKDLNEARQLSLLLRSGTLTAPVQIMEECIIGPVLGLRNITQGLKACFFGLIASILFMILRYRSFGLIATTAVIVNLILIVSIISLLPGITLTMPGIAGIVLALAVAVDANVLINERIKEELQNGLSVQKSIHEGYLGAFSSIIDSSITTLIIAVILYTMGTGSIQSFAVMTFIGTSTSMFTAIIGTRAMVNILYGGKRIHKLPI